MAFHQRFDFTAFEFQIVVLDSQRRLSEYLSNGKPFSVSASMPKRRFDLIDGAGFWRICRVAERKNLVPCLNRLPVK